MADYEEKKTRVMSERTVHIPIGHVSLEGVLSLPLRAACIVIFAHGSGSSRLSPRNQLVAAHLQKQGLATLLFDLLTPAEERMEHHGADLRFDIGLLAGRLSMVTDWLADQKETAKTPIGYFGASTGAAAALLAENMHQNIVKAIVSRGGRPDLAATALPLVKAPTLFIVGSKDKEVVFLNEKAMEQVKAVKEMALIADATHLFEEPGALESVAELASSWFSRYLCR